MEVEWETLFSDSDSHNLSNAHNLETYFSLSQENINNVGERLMNNVVDDVLLGVVFEIYRLFKTDLLDQQVVEEDVQLCIVPEGETCDVFGQQFIPLISCSICNGRFSYDKIANHTRDCVGLGRRSKKLANERISNYCKKNSKSNEQDDFLSPPPKVRKKIDPKKRQDKSS